VKRWHLFEFHERDCCPQLVRQLLTGFLEYVSGLFRAYSPKIDLLIVALRSAQTNRFVDLCSGDGGPWFGLAGEIQQRLGHPVSVVLTDKYPSSEAKLRAQSACGITYCADPVDARMVPIELPGVRTLFNGFHHFQPQEAEAILQDAVAKQQPIAIFELLQRNWLNLLQTLFVPVSVLFLTPLLRPLTWSRLLMTYVIPVAPLMLFWDGTISVLRCYRPDELLAMASGLEGPPYHWESGCYWQRGAPVTYLVGYPLETK
jgi:hypothetical protein